MTEAAAQPPDARPVVPGKLRVPFTILFSSLALLSVSMPFVWLIAQLSSFTMTGQPKTTPWAPIDWAASWVLLGMVAVCAFLLPGLALCARPALFALIGPDAGLPAYSSARRWPRLTGAAFIWGGVGAFVLIAPLLAQTSEVARGLVPDLDTTLATITLTLAVAPAGTLALAAIVLHLIERRQGAQDTPSNGRG